MSSADSLTSIGTKLERASDLAAIRISNVPVAITTLLGRIHVTEEMVTNEITRVTKAAPLKARPHDSRSCPARPTRASPVTKEQLETIRQASQREYAAVARAKAALRRAAAAVEQTEAGSSIVQISNAYEVLMKDSDPIDIENSVVKNATPSS
ncbi:hypothetical protein BGT96224_A21238 [Blumeria graminis f. sp. tritici 96224]|uniref:EKA-like protein n=1 Tax=Blumeria graminis f. sp. tritici 96224 TaxID=1268274 RepID=A0A656KPN8_BLUGR|nr:hypothetical protein BGT96224_A21238 [Blumeria graminis f. sp. tritici 96224]